jgi:predicted Rossmann fold nucleotide-binding protein DprA/Smf involved in DNA uptake
VEVMPTRSDSALATLLLTNHLVEAAAPPLSAKRYWALRASVADPAELIRASSDEIRSRTGLPDDEAARIQALLSAGTGLAFELERLERRGFAALTPFDETYPTRLIERLREQAPPVLFVVGDRSLLSIDGIGIVGSRGVTEAGSEAARHAATTAVAAGLPVISGGARGVDQVSMTAAYEAGGQVVGYLADSLERRVRDPSTRRAIADGSTCLATPFKPSAGFSVAIAMGRNKLVYASARVTFVVASDLEQGGTWEGAVEALRNGFGSVAVWTGEGAGPGNARLVELGASATEDVSGLVAGPVAPSITSRSDQLRLGL